MKAFLSWYKYTAGLVGIPVLFIILFWGFEKSVFTGTCLIAGYKCSYAFAVPEALAAIAEGEDLVVPVRKVK